MTTKFLQFNFTATANAAAYVEFTRAAKIRMIQISIQADLDAEGEYYNVDLSTVPYYQGSTNDSQGILATMNDYLGGAVGPSQGVNIVIPCDIQVENGQRIYLNGVLSGTQIVNVRAVLHHT